jgi:NADH-quinone oxidoreductase subunit M
MPLEWGILFPFMCSLLLGAHARWGYSKSLGVVAAHAMACVQSVLLIYLSLQGPRVGPVHVFGGLHWMLGMDAFTAWFLALSGTLCFVSIFIQATPSVGAFAWKFFMQGALVGALLSQDLLLFYIFFELTLLPSLYFLRQGVAREGAVTYLIFSLVGGFALLGGMSVMRALLMEVDPSMPLTTTHLSSLSSVLRASPKTQAVLFLVCSLPFFIKAPLFPFQAWLRSSYEACEGSFLILFSGVFPKVALLGFLRFMVPLFSESMSAFQAPLLALALFSVVWPAFQALAERRIRSFLAATSMSHMGFVLMGCFSLNKLALEGAMFQMLSHSLILALFITLLEILRNAIPGQESMDGVQGLGSQFPRLSAAWVFATMALISVPGTSGFVGEFLVILGLSQHSLQMALALVLSVVLSAAYGLIFLHRSFYGVALEPKGVLRSGLAVPSVGLILLILWLGLSPQPIFHATHLVSQTFRSFG